MRAMGTPLDAAQARNARMAPASIAEVPRRHRQQSGLGCALIAAQHALEVHTLQISRPMPFASTAGLLSGVTWLDIGAGHAAPLLTDGRLHRLRFKRPGDVAARAPELHVHAGHERGVAPAGHGLQSRLDFGAP